MTIITAEELLNNPHVLDGKTAVEQILLYPYIGIDILELFKDQNGSPATDIALVVDQESLILRNVKTDEDKVITTLDTDIDLELVLPRSIVDDEDDTIDIRIISKDVLAITGLGKATKENTVEQCIVTPMHYGQNHMFFQSIDRNGSVGYSFLNKYSVFSIMPYTAERLVYKEENCSYMYMPSDYVLPDNHFLITRCHSYCYLEDPLADRLTFIGKYTEDFLDLTTVVVSKEEITAIRIEDSKPSVDEVEDKLYEVLELCKEYDFSLEDIVRATVRTYS